MGALSFYRATMDNDPTANPWTPGGTGAPGLSTALTVPDDYSGNDNNRRYSFAANTTGYLSYALSDTPTSSEIVIAYVVVMQQTANADFWLQLRDTSTGTILDEVQVVSTSATPNYEGYSLEANGTGNALEVRFIPKTATSTTLDVYALQVFVYTEDTRWRRGSITVPCAVDQPCVATVRLNTRTGTLPQLGERVLIYDDSDVIFGGFIQSVSTVTRRPGTRDTTLKCASDIMVLDHYVIQKTTVTNAQTKYGGLSTTLGGQLAAYFIELDTNLSKHVGVAEAFSLKDIDGVGTFSNYAPAIKGLSLREFMRRLCINSGYKLSVDYRRRLSLIDLASIPSASFNITSGSEDFQAAEGLTHRESLGSTRTVAVVDESGGSTPTYDSDSTLIGTLRNTGGGTGLLYASDFAAVTGTEADRAAELITERANTAGEVTYVTRTKGLEPGQQQTIADQDLGSLGTFFIREVNIVALNYERAEYRVVAVEVSEQFDWRNFWRGL